MQRVEQLTSGLLGGVLDSAGLAELEHLLASDQAARSIHFGLCDREAALRGQRSGVDLHRQAVDRLRAVLSQNGQSQPVRPGFLAPPEATGPAVLPLGDPTMVRPGMAGVPASPGPIGGQNITQPPSYGGNVNRECSGPIPMPPPPWAPVATSAPVTPLSPTPPWGGDSPVSIPPTGPPGDPPAGRPWTPAEPAVIPAQPATTPAEPTMTPMPIAAVSSISDTSPWTETESTPEQPFVAMVVDDEEDEGEDEESLASLASSRTMVATLSSMLFHLTLMIVLGLWMIPALEGGITLSFLSTDDLLEEEDPFETVLLNEDLRPAADLVMAGTDSPTPGASAGATGSMGFPELNLASIDLARRTTRTASSRWTPLGMGVGDLMTELPQGSPDSMSVVVDDYRQALDRITQEILVMLSKRKVLVIWCFDQSESMKDDQQEIRSRIELVYNQLDALGAIPDDELTTAVTSFGKEFATHTAKPTVELEEIRTAIDAVPIDPSGEERMCRAVCESISKYRPYASAENRQLALILVTDESGQQQESKAYLESTIQQASAVRCKVYVLGREAVFGYPYANVRWVHPETGREHLLPVDRGPETALLEQLQTEGFEARTDAHPSGFGPYAQSRLAWKTGGIFFMLPSRETNLLQADPRRYDRVAMEPYKPDLRSRQTILADYQRRPLPSLICKMVEDLNPYSKEGAAMIKMRDSFSADKEAFAHQLQDARAKADRYLAGLLRGVDLLDRQEALRDREQSRRWQANYDLIRAQMVNYAARTRLYRTALDAAVEKIEQTPPVLPNNERLVAWKVRHHRSEVPIDESVATMLERSRQLYLTVIENHPGTPWAARAEWELNSHFNYPGGFDAETAANTYASVDDVGVDVFRGIGGGGGGGGGVELVAEYRVSRNRGGNTARPKNDTPRPVTVPVPKL